MAEMIICAKCEQYRAKAKGRSVCKGCVALERAEYQRARRARGATVQADTSYKRDSERGWRDDWAGDLCSQLLRNFKPTQHEGTA